MQAYCMLSFTYILWFSISESGSKYRGATQKLSRKVMTAGVAVLIAFVLEDDLPLRW